MRLELFQMRFQSMEVGGPGAPTTHAAKLVEEAHRIELDLATIPVQHTEANLVLDLLQTQEPGCSMRSYTEPVTPMHAQLMEVGGPGAPTPHVAKLVEEAHRQELDLATIPVQHTEAQIVLDLPQTQKPVTPMHAQSMEVGDHGAPTPHAAELVVEAHRQEVDHATIPVQQMEAHLVLDLLHIEVPVTQTPAPKTATPT